MSEKRKQYFLTLALLLTTMLGTIGCKQQSSNELSKEPVKEKSISSGDDQKGYLTSDANGAMFIRWIEINNKVNGQLTIFYAKGKRGKSTATSTHPFEGISDGENINLNFTGSRWIDVLAGKTWTGTVAGNDLTLVIPDTSGILMPVKFRTGTVEEYNRVVLGIKQDVGEENAKVQTEDAEAARKASEKKAVVATYDKVRNIATRLGDSLKSLQEDSRYDDVVKAYSNTWDKMQSNYSSLKDKAAKSPLTSTHFYTVQSALYTLQSDIYSMDSNGYSMQSKRNSISDKVKTVEEYITELQKAWV